MDVVSQVLSSRARESDVSAGMVGFSVVAHLMFFAVIVILPGAWMGQQLAPEPEARMTISLDGGPVGPRTSNASLSARPVQRESVEMKKAVEAVRPPAAAEPAMIEPKKAAPKKNETKVETTAKDPKGRTPTKGAEVTPGTAVAETGARGQGFGLSAGGGGMTGRLDIANFCCPEYLSRMISLIHNNWTSKQQAAGTTLMKYVIRRDGTITDVSIERSSGSPVLDQFARRALLLTRQLPPLPVEFTEPSLTIYLSFEYER
jgi:protein TonB